MMQPLSDIGVTGVATLAGTLRKPVAVETASRRPCRLAGSHLRHLSLRGRVRGRPRSRGDSEAVVRRRPRPGAAGRLHRRLRGQPARSTGSTTCYELAPYVTTNVTLWPQMLTVVANPDLDGRLTDAQRDWLRQAAEEAESRSAALADADARIARGGVHAGRPAGAGIGCGPGGSAGGVRAGVRRARAGPGDQGGPRPDRGAEGVDPGPTRLERLDGLCGVGPVGRGRCLGHHARRT